MSAHTPGPLEVREGGNYVSLGRAGFNATADREHVIGANQGAIAHAALPHMYTPAQFAEALANMRLFAAAPDLLAALERAIRDGNDPLHVPACVDNPTDRPCCWVAAARAAIAKAVGK